MTKHTFKRDGTSDCTDDPKKQDASKVLRKM